MQTKNGKIYLADTRQTIVGIEHIKRCYHEDLTIEIYYKSGLVMYCDYHSEEKARFEYSYLLQALKRNNSKETYV